MICPGSNVDCDNPSCRRGGCQGRPPQPPLFRLMGLDQAIAPLQARDNGAPAIIATPSLQSAATAA